MKFSFKLVLVTFLFLEMIQNKLLPDDCDYTFCIVEDLNQDNDILCDSPDSTNIDIIDLNGSKRSQVKPYQIDLIEVDKKTLFYNGTEYPPPWEDPQTKVWRSSNATLVLRESLEKEIPFLPGKTFMEVINTIQKAGCKIYLFGGLVRDSLRGVGGNDVDISFACSANELYNIALVAGFDPSISGECYVRIPRKPKTASPDSYIEGFGVHTSLYKDLIYRDFSCNTLWYDFENEVIIDRTGRGATEAIESKLSLPVSWSERFSWVGVDNKPGAKLFRWFKFRARGFDADDELINFIVSILQIFWLQNKDAESSYKKQFRKFVIGKSDAEMRVELYRNALVKDFKSESWYQRHLADLINFILFENKMRIFYFTGRIPSINPIGVFLGGGTASGKSTIRKSFPSMFPDNAIDIDPDDILLSYPPFINTYNNTICGTALYGRISYEISRQLLNEAIKNNYNFIFDSTMKSEKTVEKLIIDTQDNDYRLIMVGVTRDIVNAAESSLKRAKDTNRWVPLWAVVDTHVGFSANFEYYVTLFNSSLLYLNNISFQTPLLIFNETVLNVTEYNRFIAKRETQLMDISNNLENITLEEYENFEKECYSNHSKSKKSGIIKNIIISVAIGIIMFS